MSLLSTKTPAVAALAAVAMLGGCAQAPPPTESDPSGCSPARRYTAGLRTETVVSQEVERTYEVYVPPSYTDRKRAPVLFNFHGFGGSGEQQMRSADFRPLANRDGFIIVAPDGQGAPRHFNLRRPDGGHAFRIDERETDDLTFVHDLLEEVSRTLCVDATRVYATGFSNGGAMTSLLACMSADRFAAFAPVGAVVWSETCNGPPAAVAAVMGTADRVVPFNGGTVTCCGNPSIPPAPETMTSWARHNRCEGRPMVDDPYPRVELRRWRGCRAATSFYVVHGGGHDWPLAGDQGPFDATEALWEFLSRERLDRGSR